MVGGEGGCGDSQYKYILIVVFFVNILEVCVGVIYSYDGYLSSYRIYLYLYLCNCKNDRIINLKNIKRNYLCFYYFYKFVDFFLGLGYIF